MPPVIFSRRDAVGEDVHRSETQRLRTSFVIVGFSTSLLSLLLDIATSSPLGLDTAELGPAVRKLVCKLFRDQLEAVGEISPATGIVFESRQS